VDDASELRLDRGSTEQAKLLLKYISDDPTLTKYEADQHSGGELVRLEYDSQADTLVRIHKTSRHSGTREAWVGQIPDRLRAAAAGGSLNDTPDGESPGTYVRF